MQRRRGREPVKWTSWRISEETCNKLRDEKKKRGFISLEATINYYLETFPLIERQLYNGVEEPTLEKVFEDTVPIQLTGLPGVGKTYMCRHFLEEIEGPVLVVDPHNEYSPLTRLNLGRFFALNLMRHNQRKLRIIPNPAVGVSQAEISLIANRLVLEQDRLSDWVVVFEEAHRWKDLDPVQALINEGRKNLRKLILITPDPSYYREKVKTFKVPDWRHRSPGPMF